MAERNFILLVEDNADDRALTVRAFRDLDYEIVTAADGAAGLELLQGKDAKRLPAVVLLDLKLPKIGGLEVLRRIRTDPRTASIPVVMLTSSKEEPDLSASFKAGANSYIRKPVDLDRFVKAVRMLNLPGLPVHAK
jgi:two-component system response regulator